MQVAGLASLEIYIRSLLADLDARIVRIQATSAESFDQFAIVELFHRVIIDHFDLLQLVRGAEAIKEDEERYRGLHRAKLCHQSQIHHFLNAVAGDEGKAGVAGGHYVRVISKDGERLCSQAAGGDVKYCGQHLAGDLVHIGKHQHQALRGCKSGCESTGGK